MAIYTYNDYLRDLLKDAPCILAYAASWHTTLLRIIWGCGVGV